MQALRSAIISNDAAATKEILQRMHHKPALVDLYILYKYYRRFDLKEIVIIFLEQHVNIYSKSPEQYTPLHYAAAHNQRAIIDRLIALYRTTHSDAIIDAQDMCKRTALHYAILNEHVEIARTLLQYGAKTNIPDIREETAQSLAQKSANPELRRLFRLTCLYSRSTSPLRR
jgi:ankyrin repeat protein